MMKAFLAYLPVELFYRRLRFAQWKREILRVLLEKAEAECHMLAEQGKKATEEFARRGKK